MNLPIFYQSKIYFLFQFITAVYITMMPISVFAGNHSILLASNQILGNKSKINYQYNINDHANFNSIDYDASETSVSLTNEMLKIDILNGALTLDAIPGLTLLSPNTPKSITYLFLSNLNKHSNRHSNLTLYTADPENSDLRFYFTRTNFSSNNTMPQQDNTLRNLNELSIFGSDSISIFGAEKGMVLGFSPLGQNRISIFDGSTGKYLKESGFSMSN